MLQETLLLGKIKVKEEINSLFCTAQTNSNAGSFIQNAARTVIDIPLKTGQDKNSKSIIPSDKKNVSERVKAKRVDFAAASNEIQIKGAQNDSLFHNETNSSSDEIKNQSKRKKFKNQDKINERDLVKIEQVCDDNAQEKETRKEKIQKLIDKNLKTLFVGNLPVSVIEKSNTNQLKTHFGNFGNIESIRFRSMAFSEKMPRKQAFIAKKLHEGRDSLNAYIVFENAQDAEKALELNGKLFLDRHLRVDYSEQKLEKKRDTKRCVFLGNMPFNVSEETIWNFFQDVGDIDYVRVIRDHKTNVGKGFGYVQFAERSSVGLALKLDGGLVDGRKIRITRAKEELAQVAKKPESKRKVLEGARATRDNVVSKKRKIHSKNPKGKRSKL